MIASRLPYILLMICSVAVCLFVAQRAYHSRRKVARAASFTTMAIAGAFWMLVATLEASITTLVWKEVFWRLIPFAILCTLTGLFFFTLEFSLRLKKVPRFVLFPTVFSVLIVTSLSVTNDIHHQMWTVIDVGGIPTQAMGKWFAIQLGLTYLLALGSIVFLVRAYFRSNGLLRRQTSLLLVGILIPVMVSIAADVFAWNPLPFIDEPALSIIFAVGFFGNATLQFNAFYLLPIVSDVIIKNMQDGVLVTDIDGLILFSNLAVQQVLGKSASHLQGQPIEKILADWLPDALHAWNEQKAEVQVVVGETDFQYFLLKISSINGDSNETIGMLLTFNNITAQKNYEKRLTELAICDPLTGAYNRRYFFEMAHSYFNQMKRSASPLTILMIDLDHFKSINDTYGHLKGDQILQEVVAACKRQVRSQDIFSRYGGEEFVLAMPETSLHSGLLVAERLRRSIECLTHEVAGFPVSASIGLVETIGEHDLTLDGLINRADEAMYLSKRAGRNRVTIWGEALGV